MTLRVLESMVRGHKRDQWERTSWILAKIHNVHATRTCDLVTVEELNPMHRGRKAQRPGIQQVDADYNAAQYEALKAAEEAAAR
jgi:hypothetical protein